MTVDGASKCKLPCFQTLALGPHTFTYADGTTVTREVTAQTKMIELGDSATIKPGAGDVGDVGASASAVNEAVRAQAPGLRRCYETALKADQGVGGRVEVAWSIQKGRTAAVRLTANTTGDDALGTCVVNGVGKWRFDPSTSGDVTWPFLFSPK